MSTIIENLDKDILNAEVVWNENQKQILVAKQNLEDLHDISSQVKGRRTALLEVREMILKQENEDRVVDSTVEKLEKKRSTKK